MTARYSWGGDEFVFVEMAEEMSLRANFQVMAITKELRDLRLDGVLEICPANASYQVRYDPDVLDPHELLGTLRTWRSRSATRTTERCRPVSSRSRCSTATRGPRRR